MDRQADSAALLEGAGLRSTELRRRVLRALLGVGRSMSHPELAGLLTDLDRVSVFRTLKTLKRAGLLHAVRGLDGVQRYVSNGGGGSDCPGGHLHFLCLDCGSLSCLEDQPLPRVTAPPGTLVKGKQFLVYGLCEVCAAKSRPSAPAPRAGRRPS